MPASYVAAQVETVRAVLRATGLWPRAQAVSLPGERPLSARYRLSVVASAPRDHMFTLIARATCLLMCNATIPSSLESPEPEARSRLPLLIEDAVHRKVEYSGLRIGTLSLFRPQGGVAATIVSDPTDVEAEVCGGCTRFVWEAGLGLLFLRTDYPEGESVAAVREVCEKCEEPRGCGVQNSRAGTTKGA